MGTVALDPGRARHRVPATQSGDWVLLGGLIIGLLLLDIFVVHRIGRESPRRHLLESVGWIIAGLAFGVHVWWALGHQRAIEYYTGYLIEKSLSADNLFVFAVIFESFEIARENQRRVLYLGIFGALVFRLGFMFAGISLLESVEWVAYVFGAILIYTGVGLAIQALRKQEPQPQRNYVVRLANRVLPFGRTYKGKRFWLRDADGSFRFTRMFLAVIAIESADIVFAIDSVPAVLAITRNAYVAYSSNAFAILGLRALYFVLADAIRHLPLIRPALSVLLVIVGIKMLATQFVEPPVWVPLAVVGTVLAAAIAGSLWIRRREQCRETRGRYQSE